jgi:hypothetical protein
MTMVLLVNDDDDDDDDGVQHLFKNGSIGLRKLNFDGKLSNFV